MSAFKDYKYIMEMSIFKMLSTVAEKSGTEAYIIGGFVRDFLISRKVKDLDIVVIGDGIDFANQVSKHLNNQKVKIFKNFGTAMLRYNDWELEFVGARKESYNRDSRKPEVEPGTLRDDQLRRDFTINALAIGLNGDSKGKFLDPFEGLKDLREEIIRTPTDPERTFSDDPLRMMRAIRFATQLKYIIHSDSLMAISKMKSRIGIVSAERITTELNKIIMADKPSIGFKLLFKTGLLREFFPEMVALQGIEEKNGVRHKDNFYHTLEVLDNVAEESNNLWLRWSAILHDIAKPPTKRFIEGAGWTFHGHEDKGSRMVPQIFKRLKLPLDNQMKYVQKMVALHLRPIALTKEEATDSAIRRLLFDAGDDIDDLMILCKSDITSKNEKKVKRYLSNYEKVRKRLVEVEEKDKVRNWQPPISGDEIMATFNISPSRNVGIIKNAIKEAILEGEISNETAEVRKFMFELGESLGLKPKQD
ncbi:MAG: CCA tRNA nucleotidyltransferase [Flavobacteriales bacterium]|nr:CCA tRNA nucleotidyltransferase [Flavobacteriales bacterium]